MSYTVIVPKPVQKQLDALPNVVRNRVIERIALLAEDPQPPGEIKLKGYENSYRIRIGDDRVIYEINEKDCIVLLLRCRHRKDVYRS
jgi:mRNA interferase RelE/StbE